VVDADGTVGSPVVSGKDAIERLVAQITETPESERGLPVGEPAPEFTLPDLQGVERSLSDYRGRKVLLIFFNPHCGYCARMAPELAALPVDGPVLPLLVAAGSLEDNRKLAEEHGIRCPILLQGETNVASTYQSGGTPTGYLIDEEGHVRSGLEVGAQALIRLARSQRDVHVLADS
jgi:peroxiredoxin